MAGSIHLTSKVAKHQVDSLRYEPDAYTYATESLQLGCVHLTCKVAKHLIERLRYAHRDATLPREVYISEHVSQW